MSGPIVVSYSLSSGVAVPLDATLGALYLASEAIREAEAMGREYDQALDATRRRAEELAEKRRAQVQNQIHQRAAALAESERLARRLTRLQDIAASLATRLPEHAANFASVSPARPAQDDEYGQNTYADALSAEISRLQGVLEQSAATLDEQLRTTLAQALQSAPPGIDDLLHNYAIQRNLRPALDSRQSAAYRDIVARLLGRLELAPGAAVPLELEALAREILLAPSTERAENLALELRLQIQRYREEQQHLRAAAAEKQAWLAALPADAPPALRAALELAAAGLRCLTPEQQASAEALLETVRQANARREQEAAALVLQQSLRDLGYQVEDIENTLFVAGGVVHFQRQGWEDYHVRLRLDPHENTINFNVVRPRGMEESGVRKRQDFLAEERWCAEFPKLQQTLVARGIPLKIQRQLSAGEVPVQTVDPASLPRRREEDAAPRTQPKILQV